MRVLVATVTGVLASAACSGPTRTAPAAARTPVETTGDDEVAGDLQDPASEPIEHEAYAGAGAGDDGEAPPAPPASPASGPAEAFVAAHARYRRAHCAPPLVWSDDLARVAQAWADHLRAAGCAFEHSSTAYGENLAAGTSGAMSPGDVVDMWYREVADFDFKRGGFGMTTGHFTQLVWVDTARVGCGMVTCGGLDIYVCNYDPPGNVEGEYRANVKPKNCRK